MKTNTFNAIKTLLRMDPTVTSQTRMAVIAAIQGQPRFDPTEDMSVADAAEYLSMSRVTLWRWCAVGKVAAVQRGKKFYIPPSEVARLKSKGIAA